MAGAAGAVPAWAPKRSVLAMVDLNGVYVIRCSAALDGLLIPRNLPSTT